MKQYLLFILLAAMFVPGGCKKNNDKPAVLILSADRLAGLWVPYELVWYDSIVNTLNMTGNSMFGTLAESVLINKDHSFIPATFFNKDSILYKTDEKGTYSVTMLGKLKIIGVWKLAFTIKRLDAGEMWLKSDEVEVLYKFRKQP